MTDDDGVEALRQHLDDRGVERVEESLAEAWPLLDGHGQTSMASWKIGRIESPKWQPPVLTFTIERHGGTVLGSSRAEIQTWTVDLDARTVECQTTGHRQLRPMNARLDVRPLAAEIAEVVVAGETDPRIRWADGAASPILGRIIPDELGVPKQTIVGRRRRLKGALADELSRRGWTAVDGRQCRKAGES
jgi:hypothetical protein